MKIVFIGASKFGKRCFERILGIKGIEVCGVVTAPAHFPISYNSNGVHNVLHADVSSICIDHKIPFEVIKDGMKSDDLFEVVVGWKPEIFVVAGWYHMVPKRWRDIAPAYGLHASLLPDYSGGAPLVWAMINGEKKTGITLFQFDDGVDNGPVLGQKETPIHDEDTIATLYARIEDMGLELVSEYLPRLADGSAELLSQDESRRRVVPQRKPEDGVIEWNKEAVIVHNFVRAQTRPYPGAFTMIGDKKVTIWAGNVVDIGDLAPGEFRIFDEKCFVGCANRGAYQLTDISIDGFNARIENLASFLSAKF